MKFKRDPITKLPLPTKKMLEEERRKYPERFEPTPEEQFQDHDNPDFGPRLAGAIVSMVLLVVFVIWRILSH